MAGDGELVTVKIDVAGFYYRKAGVVVPKNATVLDALAKARADDIDAHLKGGSGPILDFSIETGPTQGLFINEISILHSTDAISGQDAARKYPAGRYAYADDPVGVDPVTKRLIRTDALEVPYVLAWQYYLYDSEGRDLARAGNASRHVEPASGKKLDQDVTIVWRLIAIFLEPTEGVGIKSKKARA